MTRLRRHSRAWASHVWSVSVPKPESEGRSDAANSKLTMRGLLVTKDSRRHSSAGASVVNTVHVARATKVTRWRKRPEGARACLTRRACPVFGRRSVQVTALNRRSDLKRGASDTATTSRPLPSAARRSQRMCTVWQKAAARAKGDPLHLPKPSCRASDACALSLGHVAKLRGRSRVPAAERRDGCTRAPRSAARE